ncbi:MAG: PVC-type heme-binding CxxCH protein [Verrucomicrobiales bacterium]
MKTILFFSLLVAATFVGGALGEIPVPDDAPQPLSPDESKNRFQLPDGFRIDLVASEPLIADPSCVAWDEKGRLFVTEIHGYNLEGHLDVTELNKGGELDLTIRRVRVGEEMKAEAREGQHGSLKLLRDNDGDGRMDEEITWADDIPAAYGVVPALGGVIVTAEPHIYFFADRDGDDKPDVRRILFSGFGRGEMERAINNPVWGPDNWIYAGQGWGGGTITGPNLKEPVKLGRTDFRFKADGSAIEQVSGSNHTFGMAFDDWGNRFLITTGQPVRYAAPLPHRYLIRNPHVASPETTVGASPYGNCFPISQPHPWRRKRGADPRWVKFYGAGEAQPNGNFTSACGQQIYRAGLFPEEYNGNHFCCDPQQSLVHRSLISRDGAGLRARRPEAQAGSEFLASSDGWFRPNNLRVGPDGALYIVDMYREIIEDYSAIPRYLQQQYGLLNGDDRGRIWRLAPEGSSPGPVDVSGVAEVAQLKHADAWWRETAQRLLIENGGSTDQLAALSVDLEAPFQSRIAAIYTLDGLGEPVPTMTLADPHPAVRLHALRAGVDVGLPRLVDTESDPNVLLQLALSLGDSGDARAAEALAKLAADHSGIRWMDAAVLSSVSRQAGAFLSVVANRYPNTKINMIEGAAVTAAATGDDRAAPAVMKLIAGHTDPSLRIRLLELATEHGFGDGAELGKVVVRSLSGDSGDAEQLAALRLISLADAKTVDGALDRVFESGRSPDFQEEAVRAILVKADPEIAGRLIAELPRSTPRLVASIVEALLARDETALQFLESGAANAAGLSQLQRYRLLHHTDPKLRTAAEELFADPPEVAIAAADAEFVARLKEPPDVQRGAELFAVHCAICHEFAGAGKAVGPSLDGEVGRPAESLLTDILQPAAEITAGYATYLVKTRAGGAAAGVLAAESATSLEIVQAAGVATTLLRKDITSVERLELSLMPATFREELQPGGIADIIGYLKSRPAPPALVLFEDDPAFPAALGEGRGRAELAWIDVSSGRACLTIEGFQRHSRQLPGWNFPIRETPAEGEFRYMRLAMKTRSSKGMMVELAADRSFPPEREPVRTYYVGENSTGWESNELAKEAPKEWRTFTIDLWEGNRDFTLTGIALTVMGGEASFDRIELLREIATP